MRTSAVGFWICQCNGAGCTTWNKLKNSKWITEHFQWILLFSCSRFFLSDDFKVYSYDEKGSLRSNSPSIKVMQARLVLLFWGSLCWVFWGCWWLFRGIGACPLSTVLHPNQGRECWGETKSFPCKCMVRFTFVKVFGVAELARFKACNPDRGSTSYGGTGRVTAPAVQLSPGQFPIVRKLHPCTGVRL